MFYDVWIQFHFHEFFTSWINRDGQIFWFDYHLIIGSCFVTFNEFFIFIISSFLGGIRNITDSVRLFGKFGIYRIFIFFRFIVQSKCNWQTIHWWSWWMRFRFFPWNWIITIFWKIKIQINGNINLYYLFHGLYLDMIRKDLKRICIWFEFFYLGAWECQHSFFVLNQLKGLVNAARIFFVKQIYQHLWKKKISSQL